MRPPPASEALLTLIDKAQSEMKDLVRNNNVDKAADMAITILSVVDDNDKLKQDESVRLMSIACERLLVKISLGGRYTDVLHEPLQWMNS